MTFCDRDKVTASIKLFHLSVTFAKEGVKTNYIPVQGSAAISIIYCPSPFFSDTHYILQAGPFSTSSQSTSWQLSVKSEHYEQSSQQIIEACHLTCQLGALTGVMPLGFDNVKYARGHNQYLFTPYQLNKGRELMHTSCSNHQTSEQHATYALTINQLLINISACN